LSPFDDRGGKEAGHAWTKDFGTINPAYWDLTDRRVEYLIDQGLMPSIMGTWATFISPIDGREYPVANPVEADADGTCDLPRRPIHQDWLLVLKRQSS
jgi:hypothetical protein